MHEVMAGHSMACGMWLVMGLVVGVGTTLLGGKGAGE